ncbi:MAG: GspE/PulE family protein [bacterium]|nr:GspE/PulE family protein [bacterium]
MTLTKTAKEIAKKADISIINLVDALIEDAEHLRASDIHIDPKEKDVVIRFRTDGVLQDMALLPKDIQSNIVSRIKVLTGLRTDEHQIAQDGRFRIFTENKSPIDIRVSIAPTFYGENVVMRLLSERDDHFTLKGLGFSKNDAEKILSAIKQPFGMILATGPTGSGKTTSLYSILKMLNRRETSIITIEDPIEYSIEGINQIQVNSRAGLTFANGLRSVLRQDPDIIMVGEIRDTETAGLAVNTALTGHLVLSTLHTNDAATTLPRLIDLGLETYLITATVNLVIGQRLVRKICGACKEKHILSQAESKGLREIKNLPPEFFDTIFLWWGKGCNECAGSGYRGRIGIYEILEITDDIRNAMLEKKSAADIKKLAVTNGMESMVEDGFRKALEGITTVEEVLRVIHE